MRNCSKRCNKCENCIDWEIVKITQKGLFEDRKTIDALKCIRFGQVSTTYVELPESKLLDDFIYE
jgi:hypothetical protein